MGPSVGWVMTPLQNILQISTPGTTLVDSSVSLIEVNVAGPVTIVLPPAANPSAGVQALPGLFADNPITIVDVGGFALTNPITIQRNNTNESIMGLASVQINVNFGGITLQPIPLGPTSSLWVATQGSAGTGTRPFQSVTTSSAIINPTTSLVAIQRAAPSATSLVLPALASQNQQLRIVDFSTGVTAHAITLTTPDGATIMQQTSWVLNSNASQLAIATLFPSLDLNSWVLLS